MKKKIGGKNLLYPSLTVLVGATVNSKPNFLTVAHVGILTLSLVSLGINKAHYTNGGIKENKTFSINIPSREMVVETDYCGIVSGRDTDKSNLFDIFYGELKTAPMISKCLVNMECRLHSVIDLKTHEIFIGDPVETYVDDSLLNNGKIDIAKLNPLLFDMSSVKYFALGEEIAGCWDVGKQLKKK